MEERTQVFYTTGLDALCEAANFVEDVERNFHGYARSASPGNSSNSNGGESKERRRNGGREIHNQLEKTRRAQMKDHFLALKKVVPSLQQKKHSNQSILKLSQKYIQSLIVKERKYQQEIQELARKRASLVELFRKKSEDFEQTHGFSVKAVLENATGEDHVDEVSSISTKSAEEVANMKDFDDEEVAISPAAVSPMPPTMQPEASPSSNPRDAFSQSTTAVSVQYTSVQSATTTGHGESDHPSGDGEKAARKADLHQTGRASRARRGWSR